MLEIWVPWFPNKFYQHFSADFINIEFEQNDVGLAVFCYTDAYK